jgi:hypothetical protein
VVCLLSTKACDFWLKTTGLAQNLAISDPYSGIRGYINAIKAAA